MKKIFFGMLVLISMAAMLSACGGTPSSGNEDDVCFDDSSCDINDVVPDPAEDSGTTDAME
ncbi:MAG: hypothetical protein HUK19_04355 [Fibrobacter sp.]|nr:hypothetical protein [Fibrobacter sp.]